MCRLVGFCEFPLMDIVWAVKKAVGGQMLLKSRRVLKSGRWLLVLNEASIICNLVERGKARCTHMLLTKRGEVLK